MTGEELNRLAKNAVVEPSLACKNKAIKEVQKRLSDAIDDEVKKYILEQVKKGKK